MTGKKERSGRIRVSGNGRKIKVYKRRAYSISMKKAFLESLNEKCSVFDVIKKFDGAC
jgi:hypothetical protein